MKRFFPLLLAFFACLAFAGCPSGEEETGGGGDGNAATTTDGGAGGDSDGGGEFKEGVDSGRAEDGSDEHK